MPTEIQKPKIVILGAGYAGVTTAITMIRKGLHQHADITIVNDSNFHYLTTLVHFAILEPVNEQKMAIYLPDFLGQKIKFVRGLVQTIDPAANTVSIAARQGQTELKYDYLIMALGWVPDYYNIDGLQENAFVLHDLESAHAIHDHLEKAFAAYDKNPAEKWHTQILVGGASYTGIEIATEIDDLVPLLAKKYSIAPSAVKITIVGIFLPEGDAVLVKHAKNYLAGRGIEVRDGLMIEKVEPGLVKFRGQSQIQEGVLIWAGGVKANPIAAKSGFEVDKKGRIIVNEFLQTNQFPNVFAIGDCSRALDKQGHPVAQTAQFAVQQGSWLGRNFDKLMTGQNPKPYISRNLGMFLSVGRKAGLGVLYVGKFKFRFKGFIAKMLKKAAGYRYLWTIGRAGLVIKKLLA